MTESIPYRTEQLASVVPTLIEHSAAALEVLRSDTRVLACKHVILGWPHPVVCAGHARAGLMCVSCLRTHMRRHTGEFELGCDECGAVGDTIFGVTTSIHAFGFVVRDTQSRRRQFTGTILVGGLGACGDCMAKIRAAS